MRGAWIGVVLLLASVPTAGAQELRGFLVLDGYPGYLTNPYLEPSFATWASSAGSAFGTGGGAGILEWSGDRVSVRARAAGRALRLADSAATWWSAGFGGALEWRLAGRVGVGLDGSWAESARPDRRRTLWGRASLRWDASSRVRVSLGPALARTRLPAARASNGGPLPGLPIGDVPDPGASPTADAVMGLARLEAWPGGRWQVGAEAFLVRTEAEDLGLDYVGGGGMLRLTRWMARGASVSVGVGGEGFGYRAALDEGDGSGEIPEDDRIWRGEADARWPVGRAVELVARLATLHRSRAGVEDEIDFYASAGFRITLGGALSPADPGAELWTREAAAMRIRVPYRGTGRLYLSGDFNGWAEPGIPLRREDEGVHAATLRLEPGAYRYRIRVVQGGAERWLELPEGADTEDDGFGGTNGVLVVSAGTAEGR